jgi:hypothetical protein
LEKASRGGGIAGGRRHSEGIKKKRKPFSERPSSWAERHDPNTTPICGGSLETLEQMLKRAA